MKKSELLDKISAVLDERKKTNQLTRAQLSWLTRAQLSWLTRDQLSWLTNTILESIKERLEDENE
jgi:hypothetical protein